MWGLSKAISILGLILALHVIRIGLLSVQIVFLVVSFIEPQFLNMLLYPILGQDQDTDGDVDVDGVDDRTQRWRNFDRLKTSRASRTTRSPTLPELLIFCESSRFFRPAVYFLTDAKFEFCGIKDHQWLIKILLLLILRTVPIVAYPSTNLFNEQGSQREAYEGWYEAASISPGRWPQISSLNSIAHPSPKLLQSLKPQALYKGF